MTVTRSLVLPLCTMALAAAACGDGSPGGPSPTSPRVTSIAPTSGPASGGTPVTIAGSNFSGPAIVTIGGVPATNVTVVSTSSMTAVSGARSAGAADVTVTIGGRSGTLPAAFTYVAGQPPVIQAITAQGTRTREPAGFADLNEEINVSVTAQDPDTPSASLTYGWSAAAGTFSGTTGASVRWRAPQAPFTTPEAVTLTVTVSDGALQVTGTVTVSVHDSVKEVADMARTFLEDFSRQQLSPEEVVRNFTDACNGKEDELLDVRNNQLNYKIAQPPAANGWTVSAPQVTVNFGSVCSFRARPGDACASASVKWVSTCIREQRLDGTKVCDLGETNTTTGVDWVAARYTADRWWLCSSDFDGTSLNPLTGRITAGSLFKQ